MLKSDEVTSSIDFQAIAPYIFTSELVTNTTGETDSFKDCMQAAKEDLTGLQYQKSWVSCQGKTTRQKIMKMKKKNQHDKKI